MIQRDNLIHDLEDELHNTTMKAKHQAKKLFIKDICVSSNSLFDRELNALSFDL